MKAVTSTEMARFKNWSSETYLAEPDEKVAIRKLLNRALRVGNIVKGRFVFLHELGRLGIGIDRQQDACPDASVSSDSQSSLIQPASCIRFCIAKATRRCHGDQHCNRSDLL